MRILIVDDAPFIRNQLKMILKPLNFEIIEASDGEEAVEKYKEFRPNIVTMDITMPKENGLKALQNILAFDPKAKVIMVTSLGHRTRVLEAIEKGAKYYIVKPFSADKVRNAILKVLNS